MRIDIYLKNSVTLGRN